MNQKTTKVIFKLSNGREALVCYIVEKDKDVFLNIDKDIKRYRTYLNLFFRIIDGRYKMDYLVNKENIKTIRIDCGNIYLNLKEYYKKFCKDFELIIEEDVDKTNGNYLEIKYKKGGLLDKNTNLIKTNIVNQGD